MIWDFKKEEFGADSIKALSDAVKESPKVKKITKLGLNLSSTDIKLRDTKELGAVLSEKKSLEQLHVTNPVRSACWNLLSTLADGDSSVTSVILEEVELPDGWSTSQAPKVLEHCKWKEFTVQNCAQKSSKFSRTEASSFYDSIGSGLRANDTIQSLSLIDIPGANTGDIDKLLSKIRRSKNIKKLDLSLEDLWDRVNIRLLADFLEENSALEELVIRGVNDFIFDVKEFVSALEKSPCLSKLSVEQLEIRGGDAKGIPKLDPTLQTKLNKIVETNKKMTIQVTGSEPIKNSA